MRIKQVFEHYQKQGQSTGEFKLCPFCGTALLAVESGGKPRPTCSSCGFIQHRNPAPTVSVLVVDEERVLLGKRGGEPGKGTWSLPCGYVEYEDDFVFTAVREAKEETGLEVKVKSVINVVSSFVTPKYHFLGIYVVGRVVGGELTAGDDLEVVEWFPMSGPLPEMGFEEDERIIKLYRSGVEGIPVDADYTSDLNPAIQSVTRSLARARQSEKHYMTLLESAQENEARLRNISDNLPGGMTYQLDMGLNGEMRQFTYVSAGVKKLHEVSVESVLQDAQTLYGQILEEDLPLVAAQEAQAQADMTTFSIEARFRLPSGAIRWHLLTSAPRRASNGHLLWDGIEMDITERKWAEDALQQSDIRFRSLIEQTTDAIFCYEYDPPIPTDLPLEEQIQLMYHCTLVECNDVCARSYGATQAQEVLGKKLTDLFGTTSGSLDNLFKQLAIGNYKISDGLGTEILADGTKRYYLNNGYGVLEDGKLRRVWGTFRDITERKRTEEQIKKALAEKDTLLRELYHRTKNNMSVIIALLDLQSSYFSDERLRQAFAEAQHRIRSMALVHQKLYESQDLSRINLKEYIGDLVTLLITSYSISSNRLSVVSDMEDVFVLIDTAVPCGLIVNELISNALKHAFPEGKAGVIEIHLRQAPDGEIALCVADNGVGLPPDFDVRTGGRLGLQTIIALGEGQLLGRVSFTQDKGLTCTLQFRDNLYASRI